MYNRIIVHTVVSNVMHVFYDYCQLRDLRQTSTYKRFVEPAVGHDFFWHELSLPYHCPTKILLGSARSHKQRLLFCLVQRRVTRQVFNNLHVSQVTVHCATVSVHIVPL